ncbi:MAG: response regulator transcription factor [Elusimicrobia bacterium]|nr:response regulator transcription factor [Elusimicrobiota bacterium]
MGIPARQRTLVVEDDPGMKEFYARFFAGLTAEGFDAVIVGDTPHALAVLRGEPVDLAVLDWNLPGISGERLLRAMREHPKTRSIGVLMVTGRDSDIDEIQALDAGADDYLSKPFEEAALLARLRSLRRRRERSHEPAFQGRFAGLDFDHAAGLVTFRTKSVRLTPKEAGLLWVFLNRPNVRHTPEQLWNHLWGYDSPRSRQLLDAAAASLKTKLGETWGGRIRYVEGEGYVFDDPR